MDETAIVERDERPGRAPGGEGPIGVTPHPAVIAVATLGIGLLGGYLLWGRPASKPPATAPSTYSSDAQDLTFGKLPAKRLASLDEWDAFDPFVGGFPVPPESYAPPLVPPGPPIPALPLATNAPVAPNPGMLAPSEPPTLRGRVRNMPMPVPDGTLPPGISVAPSTTGGGTLPPGLAPGAGTEVAGEPRLILATVSGVDMGKAQSAAASVAGRFGGTARSFSHMTDEGAVDALGVLLIVPTAKADAALAAVKGLGAASVDEDSNLGGSDRQGRLRGIFSSRLAALRKRREELLVQFLPEADPVKDIDAAIDKEARALAAMSLPGSASRMAAIRVLLRE